MAKTIKFDLPIDGVKVAALDELRDHFTTEIIGHFRSGLLARWLRSRGWTRELAAVEALATDDDATTLKELCRIFEIEADDDAIAAATAEATGVPGIRPRKSDVPGIRPRKSVVLSSDTILMGLISLQIDIERKKDGFFEIGDFYEDQHFLLSIGIVAGIVAGMAGEEVQDDNVAALYKSVPGMARKKLPRGKEFKEFTLLLPKLIALSIGMFPRDSTALCPDTILRKLLPLHFGIIEKIDKDIEIDQFYEDGCLLSIGIVAGIVAGMAGEEVQNANIVALYKSVPGKARKPFPKDEKYMIRSIARLIAAGIAQATSQG